MEFDLDKVAATERYELLLSTVVPRPIALITTLSSNGTINAAPYSLFNVLGHDPPIVAVSVLPHAERRLKDSGENILATGEFVANLVSESVAEAMNVTCIDAPPGVNELTLAKLTTAPSVKVAPPRVAASPVSLECRLLTSLSFGPNQAIVIGRVVQLHVADEFVIDQERCLIDTPKLKMIGAMHGARWYAKTSDLFAMDRPTWVEWLKAGKVSPAR
jgi:flavin reductase (DIM6/NTAB) family NADH-FMN oxidoreductase RutF